MLCVHADLKLENFLVDENQLPKFIDFGTAVQLDSADSLWNEDCAGSQKPVNYMSPEMERLMSACESTPLSTEERGLALHYSTKRATRSRHGGAGEKHGLNTDVWSMGVVVEEIGKKVRNGHALRPLIDFAKDPDRAKRPSAVELARRCGALLVTSDNESVREIPLRDCYFSLLRATNC